mmetsp:Transcript_68114/g.221785  ORF Transcript_68114/g.221785 Transcript_68114/m.221785 type:complete len:442 (-) Transcript_68114:37-1362(-)
MARRVGAAEAVLRSVLLGLVAVGWTPLGVDAKVQQVRVKLGNGGGRIKQRIDWQYLGKFGFDLGKGSWSVRVKEKFPQGLAPNTSFDLEVYLDEQWPEVEAEKDVCKRKQHSKQSREALLGAHRDFGPISTGNVRQTMRPHVWYFAISDCNRTLGDTHYVLIAEFTALNPGGSQFSVEMQWAPSANLLTLLGCTAFLGLFWQKSAAFRRSTGSLHPVIWTLLAVLLTQYAAQCLHTGHLAVYRSNGIGSMTMEVLSEVFFIACQVIQTSLLILIASGYTLLQSKLGDLDIVLPICFLVAILHIALAVLDRTQVESSTKFTDHDGYKGYAFCGLRLVLYVWFLWAGHSTAASGGMRLRSFMQQFRVAASLYFLSYPIMFMVVQLVAPYLRKPIMEVGLMGAQVGSNVWLTFLFLSRGAFFEVSSLSASPLPGGSPTRFFKDE